MQRAIKQAKLLIEQADFPPTLDGSDLESMRWATIDDLDTILENGFD